jgi:hypothetical protein
VVAVDPESRTVEQFGDFPGAHKYAGGVLAHNGKIYAIPNRAQHILEVDPETNATTLIDLGPAILEAADSRAKKFQWNGGAVAPNGKIYGIPWGAQSVLEFDPKTRTVSTLGNLSNGGGSWAGAVLLPNGRILGVPYRANSILEIDPETRTVTTWGDLSPYRDNNGTDWTQDDACASNTGWRGAAFVPATGLVYAYPWGRGTPLVSPCMLVIDPAERTTRIIEMPDLQVPYEPVILAPNGRLYGIPLHGVPTVEFDPLTETWKHLRRINRENGGYGGAAVSFDGHIYAVPNSARTILEIIPGGDSVFDPNVVLSGYWNQN